MPARDRLGARLLPDLKSVSRRGLFRLPTSWQQKVRIGIGSDVGAGTTFSMLRTLGRSL